MPALPQTQDALGGAGSIAQDLRSLIVTGLSRTIDGALAKNFPVGSFNETETVNARGQVRPGSAPAAPPTASEAFVGIIKDPVFIGVAIAITASVALFVALRK